MRKLMRSVAKAKMREDGASKVNQRMALRWRVTLNAYPGFRGQKKQRRGSRQPILAYPIPVNPKERPW